MTSTKIAITAVKRRFTYLNTAIGSSGGYRCDDVGRLPKSPKSTMQSTKRMAPMSDRSGTFTGAEALALSTWAVTVVVCGTELSPRTVAVATPAALVTADAGATVAWLASPVLNITVFPASGAPRLVTVALAVVVSPRPSRSSGGRSSARLTTKWSLSALSRPAPQGWGHWVDVLGGALVWIPVSSGAGVHAGFWASQRAATPAT